MLQMKVQSSEKKTLLSYEQGAELLEVTDERYGIPVQVGRWQVIK